VNWQVSSPQALSYGHIVANVEHFAEIPMNLFVRKSFGALMLKVVGREGSLR
jgi:hypothetical protein